jgi:hypothetical protein
VVKLPLVTTLPLPLTLNFSTPLLRPLKILPPAVLSATRAVPDALSTFASTPVVVRAAGGIRLPEHSHARRARYRS